MLNARQDQRPSNPQMENGNAMGQQRVTRVAKVEVQDMIIANVNEHDKWDCTSPNGGNYS